jgi:MFS transporter, ACS family, 4-hydroxyphenylacetate permease
MRSSNVAWLCLSYFGLVTSLNTVATWTPQIVREAMPGATLARVGVLAALPAIVTVFAMPAWSARSDRLDERRWHYTLPVAIAASGWVLVSVSGEFSVQLFGLVLSTVGAFTGMAIFWTIPASVLSDAGRPAGIALISSAGILGSAVSPSVVGVLRDLTGSFASGLWYATAMLLTAALAIRCVSGPARAAQT